MKHLQFEGQYNFIFLFKIWLEKDEIKLPLSKNRLLLYEEFNASVDQYIVKISFDRILLIKICGKITGQFSRPLGLPR